MSYSSRHIEAAMKDVAVISYCRTGIAKAVRGALNKTHGIAMAGHVLAHAVERAGIESAEVEDVILGCGLPEGATGHNVARNAALAAGFGVGVPGMTVNRYCGSGISAASMIATRVAAGEITVGIAGGVESISLVQFHLNLNGFFYEPLQQVMPAVWWTMNQTADFVAKKYGFTREQLDAYVVTSQARVAAAAQVGKYAEEIVPFATKMEVTAKATGDKSMEDVVLDRDEGPRPDTTEEKLASLKPVFEGGTTTAGNASQLSDGAAAMMMMDADLAARRGLPILGLFRGMELGAVAPEEMSIAITPAIRKLMKRHALAMTDIDLWELHEAYAVTTLYNQRELETPWEATNVNGGAIALGHPYGASGIR
jgi:acetyl-CoA C-acetyltransferase